MFVHHKGTHFYKKKHNKMHDQLCETISCQILAPTAQTSSTERDIPEYVNSR